jgi:hypothetical protein
MDPVPSYDVAISFAGEDRAHADALALQLKQAGVRVFYDGHERATLWGKDLYQYLSDLYCNRARYCVIFLSSHYARKLWTRHELKAAQARAFSERSEYILPVRLDDTEIDGVLPTVGYLRMPPDSIADVAQAVLEKLRAPPPSAVAKEAPRIPPAVRQAQGADARGPVMRVGGTTVTFDALRADLPAQQCIVCGVATNLQNGVLVTPHRQRLPDGHMLSLGWLLVVCVPGTLIGWFAGDTQDSRMAATLSISLCGYVIWALILFLRLTRSITLRLPYCGDHYRKRLFRDRLRPLLGLARALLGFLPLIPLSIMSIEHQAILLLPATLLFWGCTRAAVAMEQWALALGPRLLHVDGAVVTLDGVSSDFARPSEK